MLVVFIIFTRYPFPPSPRSVRYQIKCLKNAMIVLSDSKHHRVGIDNGSFRLFLQVATSHSNPREPGLHIN